MPLRNKPARSGIRVPATLLLRVLTRTAVQYNLYLLLVSLAVRADMMFTCRLRVPRTPDMSAAVDLCLRLLAFMEADVAVRVLVWLSCDRHQLLLPLRPVERSPSSYERGDNGPTLRWTRARRVYRACDRWKSGTDTALGTARE